MKTVINLVIIIIALLSLAAGIAKVTHSPQEVHFLQSFGFNDLTITLYGVVQVLASIVLSVGAIFSNKRAKLAGAILVAMAFLLSSILIFVSGNWAFGLLSLLPVALTGQIINQTGKIDSTSI
jgi:hypothetical protein